MATEPVETRAKADAIIKNTYRTLMTRGMKGCFVYCTDAALADYLRESIPRPAQTTGYGSSVRQSDLFAAEEPPEE